MRRRRKGFTLVEMIAVSLVMALAAAIAVPNLARIVVSQRKRNFLSALDRIVVKARETAIRTGQRTVLAVNGNGGLELQIPNGSDSNEPSALQGLTPPAGLSFSKYELNGNTVGDGDWQASFYPDGRSDDAALEVQEGNSLWYLRIDPMTGIGFLRTGQLDEAPLRRWEAGQLAQRG